MPDWPATLWYQAVRHVSLLGLTLGFSLRIEGPHHVPRSGPALLVANHQSYLDPVLVGVACPRPLVALARETLFRQRAFAWLIRSLNAVPIDQRGFAREGLRTIWDQLLAGRAVLVFPEGERTWDGGIQSLRAGVSLLIKKAQAPVLPVGIAGAFAAWRRQRRLPVLAPLFLPGGDNTLAVSIGAPMDARELVELPRERVLTTLEDAIRRAHTRAERLRRKV